MEFIVEEIVMKNKNDFTHFNEEGRARMVDVGEKAELPQGCSSARVLVNRRTLDLIRSGGMKKGDVLTVAQIAGIMGAKRTPDLIPMCHPVLIDGIDLSCGWRRNVQCGNQSIGFLRRSGPVWRWRH